MSSETPPSRPDRHNAFTHRVPANATVVALAIPMPAQGLLAGRALVVKDNIDVAGWPTTAGSPVLAGHVPGRSAQVVQRLQDQGAVVIGKTNLHEFALGVTNNNAHFGPARNPYAPERITGGSSGGTAAALAAGHAALGLGTDTGGSVRIPAALCGVVGFRPSTGRWSQHGVVPISITRDTVGPMALDVADCALLDAIVCGEAPALPAAALHGLRLGVPRRGHWDDLDPAVAAAAERVLDLLRTAGAELVELDAGIDLDACARTGLSIAMGENLAGLSGYFASHGLPFDPATLADRAASPDVRHILAALADGTAPLEPPYPLALQQRQQLRERFNGLFARERIEALIFPTTPLPAAPIGDDENTALLGRPVSTFFSFTRNVGPASVAGLPSITLPMGLCPQGLPLGICLDGPERSDRRLLAIAQALFERLPPLPAPPPALG